MGESRTPVPFGAVKKLAVPVLLGPILIDKFVTSIHSAEGKVVSYQSPQLPIQLVQESKSEAEKNTSDIRQVNDKLLRLFVTAAGGEPRHIMVA